MAPHSSTLAWKIPWTEEPGRLQSMGSLRVRHDWVTSLSLSTFMHWRRKWQPTPVFLLETLRDGGAWWAAVYGVTQSWTQLKWFSSSSSSKSCLTFWDPVDSIPPGPSVHVIFQVRILEWDDISSSRRSSRPKDWDFIPCRQILLLWNLLRGHLNGLFLD